VLLLPCIGRTLVWKQIKHVVRVEKTEVGLKPIVETDHFIFSSRPSAFSWPFPSSSPCTALASSLVPSACGSGQNGRRPSLRLAEVTKNGTKTSLFKLPAAVHWDGCGTAAAVAARGISSWFFLFARLSLGICSFSRASGYFVLCMIM